METKVVLTIAFTAIAVVGIIGAVYTLLKDKYKAFNAFGCITALSCVGLIVMGIIVHHWWIWLLSAIVLVIALLFLLVNNLETGPTYPD